MSISDQLKAAASKPQLAQDRFIQWLNEQDESDREAINFALMSDNPKPGVRDIAAILIEQGAPVTPNRLYEYRRSIRAKRVRG